MAVQVQQWVNMELTYGRLRESLLQQFPKNQALRLYYLVTFL